MGSKNKKQKKQQGEARIINGAEDSAAENRGRIITDPRFASVHSDPRFQKVPKRESKVAIDARFQRVFTDKGFASSSAPLDKRGKRRRGSGSKDSLREFYHIEEEAEEQNRRKKNRKEKDGDGESEESEDESEREEIVKSGGKLDLSEEDDSSEEEESDEGDESDEGEIEGEVESTTEEEEETEEDDEAVYEDGRHELEENIPEIEQETSRLAVLNMDWRHVSATDLYVVLSSFLPKDGQIMSIAVYPSEFGIQRMKEEEIHGPVGLFDDEKGKEDDDDDDDEDEDIINQKLRAYEISRLRYYYAVVQCDSCATADYLYKACDGVEFERSSNKLDLRFIPDSMEFKHPPRDVATETPANYEGLDFHSRALQMSKVNLSWDDDEPHRQTLKRKFKADQLAELELKEFMASDESESDDDEIDATEDKKKKKKDKYRALIQSGDNDSDDDEKEDNQDMEVTFNTGLEDLSKRILEKKDKKSETVWEAYLRKRQEKKKVRKNKADKYSSDDDESSYTDEEPMEQPDDFFVEEPLVKRKKDGKIDKEAEEEASRAELELLLADDKAEGAGVKGYNLKRKKAKGKKGKEEVDEEKVPIGAFDDPRFSAVFTSPLFALDPTDPQFKRSAAYARQVAQKQKGNQKDIVGKEVTEITPKSQLVSSDAETIKDKNVKSDVSASKTEKYELSSAIRSVKMKIKQVQPCSNLMVKKGKEKQAGGSEQKEKNEPSSLIQRIKKKTKGLSK